MPRYTIGSRKKLRKWADEIKRVQASMETGAMPLRRGIKRRLIPLISLSFRSMSVKTLRAYYEALVLVGEEVVRNGEMISRREFNRRVRQKEKEVAKGIEEHIEAVKKLAPESPTVETRAILGLIPETEGFMDREQAIRSGLKKLVYRKKRGAK